MWSTDKFEVVTGFLDVPVCNLINDYVALLSATGGMMAPDWRIPGADRLYGNPLIETLLVQKLAQVEAVVGEPLWPSYSYLRLHRYGMSMERHTDREGSEIGVSILINGDEEWPLWLAAASGDVPIRLNVGDAVVYNGRTVPHWREKYEGQRQVQCILFFVRQNGECADWKFDKRASVGLPQNRAFAK